MATQTLENRLAELENRLRLVEARMPEYADEKATGKTGWRAFVGVDAKNPLSKDAAQFGREWRFADSPDVDGEKA